MADQKAILKAGDKEIELPILSGTEGQDVIDVRSLGAQGYFTFDPGFMATGSCESEITYIDGANGVLLHRGYPIEELARDANYLEVCYMLLNGEAPDKAQNEEFRATITRHTMVHEQNSPTCCWLGVPSPLWVLLIMTSEGNLEKEMTLCLW